MIPGPNKYGAKRTELDGIVFDSGAEASRYALLSMLERRGKISGLVRQRKFNILDCAEYRADFAYWDFDRDRFVVEDVKGYDTAVSKLKRKLVKKLYGIEVEVVR